MMRAQYYVLSFVAFFLLAPPASHAVPQLTSVHGKLTDVTGNPVSGNYDFIFRIYSVESGGTALWTEYWNSTNGQVSIGSTGYFSALLGSHTAINLPFDQQYWLSIQVANDLLSPRFKMGSVPYTYRANITENLAAGTKATGTLNMNNYDITGAGGIYGTTLYEGGTALSSKYALQSTSISSGSGLSGGGDLSAARTLSIANGGVTNIMIAAGAVNKTQVAGVLDSTVVGSIDAANITTGTLSTSRLPLIGTPQLAAGTLAWGNISGYSLSTAWTGTLGGGNITSGTITSTQLASGAYSAITGIGTQAQNLNMGGNNLTNYNYLAANDSAKLNGQLSSYYLDTSSTAQTKSGSLTVTGAWLNATNLNVSTNAYFGGNVGIGTASPASNLHISGGNPTMLIVDAATGGQPILDFRVNNVTKYQILTTATGQLVMRLGSSGSDVFIDTSHNVGINTTSPGTLLHAVSGASGHIIRAETSGANAQIAIKNTNSGSNQWTIGVQSSNSGSVGPNNSFSIRDENAGTRLLVDTSGNVGIGTTSPSSKLEVAGTLNATSGGTSMLLDANGDLKMGV